MAENIEINCIKKVLSEQRNFLNAHLSSEDLQNSYEKSKVEISNFIRNGTTVFQRKEIIFGEEEIVDVTIEQSLADISVFEISKAMVSFNENPVDYSFNSLINAYLLDLLTFVSTSENFETSSIPYLESDLGLLYVFTITFCPELLDKVEPIILQGLAYSQKVRDNNIRAMRGSYGRDSILYFAYYMAKEKRSEQVASQILKYCNKKIVPCYANAVEYIYCSDKTIVDRWFKELADYHIKNSKTSDLTYPLHVSHWIYFPIEILGILKLRANRGLDNSFVSHKLFNIFISFYNNELTINDYNKKLIERLLVKET